MRPCQGSSDKNCLNVLRGEGLRRRGGLSTGSDNIRARIPRWEIAAGAGTRLDNETTEDPEQKKRAGIGAGTKIGIRVGTRVGIGARIKQNNEKKEDLGWGNKEDPTRVQSFASYSFFLATHLFFFFTISSLKSMTTWPGLFTTAG